MVRGRLSYFGSILVFVCLAPGQAQGFTRVFEVSSPHLVQKSAIHQANEYSQLPGVDQGCPTLPGEPQLSWIPLTVDWPVGVEQPNIDLTILAADTISLPLPLAPTQRDMITSDTATGASYVPADPRIYNSDDWFPNALVRVDASGQMGEAGIVAMSWSPLQYHPKTQRLIVIRRALFTISDNSASDAEKAAAPVEAVDDATLGVAESAADKQSEFLSSISVGHPATLVVAAGAPLALDYLIVTRAAFVNAVKPLALWKARKGLRAGIATIEEISAQYSGVDPAAQLREYLKAAYAAGLKWVVIGGDETVAPVRRAYADFPAYDGNPYNLQLCDLYFAELNGNWDADGDGIWGEFFGDQAQIQPELYVGRLPYSTAAEATAIVNKIIAYECGPSSSAYLTKTLSVATDQFRDWNDGQGQFGVVAQSMPAGWTNDLSTMIEAPSGSDPAPLFPDATTFGTSLASGAGWVNYFVHGRADGFVVRSAGIMEWPRAYVFTNGAGGDGNAYLNLVPASSSAGIHLSAACDQGGFDLDSPPYSYPVGESVSEKLLFMPGGAVAFVAQSRWGWVSTSYKLVQKFYDYVNNSATPNHVGVYQTLAKLAYGSFRDLVFGNNLYGDPEMPVWKSAPLALSVYAPETFAPGSNNWTLRAVSGTAGVAGAVMTVSIGDSVWVLGQTGADGSLPVSISLPTAPSAVITASKIGYRVWTGTLPMSIISDVFDDGDAVPSSFLTISNYPNPFNAGTVISLSLPSDEDVSVDVFDVLGRRVRTVCGAPMTAGEHRVAFDATDDDGRRLASGVYFARVATAADVVMRKLVLVR